MIDNIPWHIIREVKGLDLTLGKNVPNPEIGKLLDQTILLGGKRFRPLLIYLMSDFFELPLGEMAPFARAIEFIHSATLTHDDVIDQASERRGGETLNMVASNKKAVLSGDYLLAQTMLELSRIGDMRFIQEISVMLMDLVDGEWLQMSNTLDKKVSREKIEQVAHKKTASTITWCCVIPALKANATEEVLLVVRSFGDQLGLAFQEVDDIIDFYANGDKNTLQDIRNGILNSITHALLEHNPQLRESILQMDLAAPDITIPWELGELNRAIARVRVQTQERLGVCREKLQEILKLLGKAESWRTRQALESLHSLLDLLAQRKH